MPGKRRSSLPFAVCLAALLAVPVASVTSRAQVDRLDWEQIARQNEQTYGFKGVISGRVLLDNGKPAVGFFVFARFGMHQSGASGEGGAFTDAQGRYRIHGLNPQAFNVQAINGGKPYLTNPPRTIPLHKLPNATAQNVDFTLYLGPEVTVRVQDAQTNQPVAGITVKASETRFGSPQPIGKTDTRGELRFRVKDIETEMSLDDREIFTRGLSIAPGSHLYHRLDLPKLSGNPNAIWTIKTYEEKPERQKTVFQGIVRDPQGKPVPGAELRIVRHGTTEEVRGTTDAMGRFAIPTYRMHTTEYGNWNGGDRRGILVVAQKGALRTAHLATPEETWSTISIRLQNKELASLTGQIVNPQGKPLTGVPISYTEYPAKAMSPVQMDGGTTDANGRFAFTTLLPDAAYQFVFGRIPYSNPTGFGTTRFPVANSKSPFLQVRLGEHRDLKKIVVHEANRSLTGRIVDRQGHLPKMHLIAVIQSEHNTSSAPVDPDGTFRFTGLVDEPIQLYIFQSKDGHGFRTTPGNPDEVARQQVRIGQQSVKVVVK